MSLLDRWGHLTTRHNPSAHGQYKGESVLTQKEMTVKDNYPHTALIIVQEITLRNTDNGPLATGGSLAIHMPWQPAEDDLEALGFRYRVPASKPGKTQP